jgi:hypothetical protein
MATKATSNDSRTASPATADANAGKPEGLALLREPFPAHQISKLPKPFKKDAPKGRCSECGGYHGLPAMHLDYVGHAALTDRLLDADPLWTWEPVADPASLGLPVASGGMWIRLTVCGVTRLGYGSADGKTGGDGVKEVIGDALRNAAMRFGAALDLWHKGHLHDDNDADPSAPEPASPRQQVELPAERNGHANGNGAAPAGYAEFVLELEAEAAKGMPALMAKMNGGELAWRRHLTLKDAARWTALKGRANEHAQRRVS